MNLLRRIKPKIIDKVFYSRSKKISSLIRSILSNDKLISILDIGAGNRYLPVLLNFDGSANISLIDPHRSLFWSYKNLKKKFIFKESLNPYQLALGEKTKKRFFYVGKRSTGSTFVNIFKNSKKKKTNLDMNYFSKGKETVKIFSAKDFLKKFNVKKPEIVKIDVEGLEIEVLKSVLKVSKPTIIQIETNVNSSVYFNTFDKVHNTLTSQGYLLATLHPSYSYSEYASTKDKIFTNYYDYPKIRSIITQTDNIYILKKNNSLRKILILIGYGFIIEAFQIYKLEKKINSKNKNKLNNFFKNFIPKSIFKTL